MTQSHTPGPWHTGGKHDMIVYAEDGQAIASATTHHGLIPISGMTANATLIAAAPELLAALDLAEGYMAAVNAGTPFIECEFERKQARAAIAKARGK